MKNWFKGSKIEERHIKHGVSIVLWSQWWDEGKWKITDVLTQYSDVIIRFNGWHNAWHTVEFEGKSFDLHILPSWVLSSDKINIITSACVLWIDLNKIDLKHFKEEGNKIVSHSNISEILKKQDWSPIRVWMIPEIEKLELWWIDFKKSNLKISWDTPVIGMHNVLLDAFDELSRKFVWLKEIWSTWSWISRSYAWDIQRYHFTVNDLLYNPDIFYKSIESLWVAYSWVFRNISSNDLIEKAKEERNKFINVIETYWIEILQDEKSYIKELLKSWKTIVWEWAQSSMIGSTNSFFGTASDPNVLRFLNASWLQQKNIWNIFLVHKMPASSVWVRPWFLKFPDSEELDNFREKYNEFGVSTNRSRDLFEYCPIEIARWAKLNLNWFSDLSKVVPVYNRVDWIEDSMSISDWELRIVTWYTYEKKDIYWKIDRVNVWLKDDLELCPENLLRNYPSKSLQVNTFWVQTKDLNFEKVEWETVARKIEKLLWYYNWAIFEEDGVVDFLIWTWPQRQDLELKSWKPLRKL